MMAKHARVLICDDDAAMRDSCRQVLEREGLAVAEAPGGREALRMLSAAPCDLVILDLKMPGMGGLDVLEQIRAANDGTSVVVITGYASIDSAVEAMKHGATDFLPKPFSSESLRVIARKALAHRRLEVENRRLRSELARAGEPPHIVGQTPQMKRLFDLIERVAPTDSNVLVMGESGTGKELVARALHTCSGRAQRPFVVVDCATLVGTLFENELFGHVKGSFTGASSTTHGRFELADGGTLFLDEVGCVEPGMQQKLLRVLEQRQFTRVGSSQPISVDVRLIAATNMDLATAVAAGTFREDLYYRLSVFPLVLPPLRERRADIPLLADHFVRLHCGRRRKSVVGIGAGAMEALMAHDWPGNVRELSNVIERAVVLADGAEVEAAHLLYQRQLPSAAPKEPPSEPLSLAQVERRHVLRVLEEAGGNRSRTAELLGIDRKTLWRKLRQYAAEDA